MIKTDPATAAALFPVLAWDAATDLFVTGDPCLAFGWMGTPLQGGDARTEQRLRALLEEDWPAHSTLQLLLLPSPNLTERLAEIRKLRPPKDAGAPADLLDRFILERARFLEQGLDRPLPQTGQFVRDFRLVVTAKCAIAEQIPTTAEVDAAVSLRNRVETALKHLGLAPERLDNDGYLAVMSVLLHRDPQAAWRQLTATRADPERLLNEQVLDWHTEVVHDRKKVRLGEHTTLTFLSVKQFPAALTFGHTLAFVADTLAGNRGLTFPFYLAVNLLFPAAHRERTELVSKRHWTIHNTDAAVQRWIPGLGQTARDFELLMASMDQGHRPLKLALSIAVYATSEAERQNRVSIAVSYFSELGYVLIPDDFIPLPLLVNTLPFGTDAGAARALARYRTMTSEHAARLLPVFGDPRGHGSPMLTLVSRSGQYVRIDPWDSPSNYNIVIAAMSGSGKSVAANELIASVRATGGIVYVIDIGGSYRALTSVLGGEYLDFDETTRLSLNPFAITTSYDDEGDMLEALVAAMAAQQTPLEDVQRAGLAKVMKDAWETNHTDTSVDLIAARLLESDDRRLRDVGNQLYLFTSEGRFGRYFQGHDGYTLQTELTVLDLEGLRRREQLQKIVLLMLIYRIQQTMLRAPRGVRKLLVIDEAWELLAQPMFAGAIETAFRRFRKLNAAAAVVTQSLYDLTNHSVGRAILENAQNLLLLAQSPDTIDKLEGERTLALDGWAFRLLKTVHTLPGRYSEIFFRTGYDQGVGRLVLPPFHQLLYSTEPHDVAAIREREAQGLSLTEAINDVLASRAQHRRGEGSAA